LGRSRELGGSPKCSEGRGSHVGVERVENPMRIEVGSPVAVKS